MVRAHDLFDAVERHVERPLVIVFRRLVAGLDSAKQSDRVLELVVLSIRHHRLDGVLVQKGLQRRLRYVEHPEPRRH